MSRFTARRARYIGALLGTSAIVMAGPFATPASAKPPKPTPIAISATVPGSPSPVAIANGGSTRQASITFTVSSTATGAKFTCALDASRAKACPGTVTYNNLADGTHTFHATASAAGFRKKGTATFTWHVDHTPPPAVTFSGVPTHDVATSPTITFSGEANDTFTCSIDEAPATTCTPGSTGTSAVTGEGPHSLTVVPTDAAGNVGPAASVTWTIDLTAPTVVINDPPPSPTAATSETIDYTVNDPTATVGCKLNGSTVTCSTTSWSSSSALHNGTTYTFVVTATDAAGNHSSDSATWTVDTTAPATPVLSSTPNGITNQTVGTFGFSTGTLTDTYKCALDPADPTNASSYSVCTSGVSTNNALLSGHTSALTDELHKFFVFAVSAADVPSSTTEYDWTVDTAPPTLTVTGVPSGTTNVTDVAPVISVTDANPVAATCALDGPTSSTTCGPYTSLADGAYTLTVNDSDAAGNAATAVVDPWTVDTTAPVATIHTPKSLTGAVTVTFSEPVKTSAGPIAGLSLAGTTKSVPVVQSCKSRASVVACSGSFTSVMLAPKSALVPGQHYLVTFAGSNVTDVAGNAASAVSATFRGQQSLPARNVAAHYSWSVVKSAGAIGGSYRTEHKAGATASWKFRGKSVTWWTRTGPTQGKASVYVDGRRVGVANNYARLGRARVARTYRRLGAGAHTVTIVVSGRRGSIRGGGTFVAVDAFTPGGGRRVANPALTSQWGKSKANAITDLRGAQLRITFRGTSFTWGTIVGRGMGRATVSVDRGKAVVVDNYAKATKAVARSIKGLADKLHTVVITVTGRHHTGATGSAIVIRSMRVG